MRTSKFKGLTLAAALALPLSAQANNIIIEDWFLDPDGALGTAPSTLISSNLSTVGDAWISLTPTGPGTATFMEWGVFSIPSHDGGVSFPGFSGSFGGELTALFFGFGEATAAGGATFLGGDIVLYSDTPSNLLPDFTFADGFTGTDGIYGADNGTAIAAFSITSGSVAALELDFTPVNNTDVTIRAEATFLAPGYFYMPDGTTDMVEMLPGGSLNTSGDSILFGFATQNASTNPNPNPNFFSEVVGEFAGVPAAAFDDPLTPGADTLLFNNVEAGNFVVSNGGQFKLTTVPEPASIGLIGLGLLALGMGSRRRKHS